MEIEKEKLTLNEEKKHKKQKVKFYSIDYPLVTKADEGHLTFSVPDVHYFHVVDMPNGSIPNI